HTHFLEDCPSGSEAVDAGGHATIDGDLEENLLDLVFRDAVGQCAPNMQLDLMRPVESGKHGKVQHAARFAIQPRASPDFAPAVLGNQFLQRAAEIVGGLDRVVHKVSAKHRSANAQAF